MHEKKLLENDRIKGYRIDFHYDDDPIEVFN